MRAGRLLIIIAILVILALAAVYAILQLSNQDGSADNAAIPTSNIVMMIQPVERGGFITEDMLDYLAYPTSETIETMFTNFDDVVGLQARYDLEPGIPVTSGMLVGGPDDLSTIGSDQALLIPEGMVAFPITIDRFTSLGYGLRAGDHVNVIATMLFVDLDPNFQSLTPNSTSAVITPDFSCSIMTSASTSRSNSFELAAKSVILLPPCSLKENDKSPNCKLPSTATTAESFSRMATARFEARVVFPVPPLELNTVIMRP